MSKTTDGFIYLIHAVGTDRYKIGFARDPRKRLKNLATASPFALELLACREGTVAVEIQLHGHLKDYRVCGEWFEVADRSLILSSFEDWSPLWAAYVNYEVTDADRRQCTDIMAGVMRSDHRQLPDVRI